MSALELKPCPFCGGPAQLISGAPGCHYVRCEGCGASGDDRGREKAVAIWNRRTPLAIRDDENHKATVERCAQIADEIEQPGIPGTSQWLALGNFAGQIRDEIRSLIKEDGE